MQIERSYLLPLQTEDFEIAEESFCRVDAKGCVQVKTNFYSTPLRPGTQVRVRLLPSTVEVLYNGQVLAQHPRCYERRQQILSLEHYLDVLLRKPGALAGSKPLEQWRAEGRWSKDYDELWTGLQNRFGAQAGTRLMIELLGLGRQYGYERLSQAIRQALTLGAIDQAAVRYLLVAESLQQQEAPPLLPEEVRRAEYYARPLPPLTAYDGLLSPANEETVEVSQ